MCTQSRLPLYNDHSFGLNKHRSASFDQLLRNGYTEPHSVTVKGHATWSAVGLCFRLFSVLLIIECVTYLYAKIRIFWKTKMLLQRKIITTLNWSNPINHYVYTIVSFICSQGIVVESDFFSLRPAILMCLSALYITDVRVL